MAKNERPPLTGQTAPDFELPCTHIETFRLSEQAAGPLVLFFYPKDDTSGCTREAIEFTEKLAEFKKLGVGVFGVSPDPIKKHEKFQDKHSLKMPLIADENHVALNAFGVWVEKSMYGRKYMGVERSTFLIGKGGKIEQVWRKVKVNGHVEAVLEAARALVD